MIYSWVAGVEVLRNPGVAPIADPLTEAKTARAIPGFRSTSTPATRLISWIVSGQFILRLPTYLGLRSAAT
jgi:hypothetical protein